MRRSSSIATTALVVLAASATACGFAPGGIHAPTRESADGEWISGPVDLKKVTAIVRVAPPPRLKAQMERAAARTSDPDLADFLRGNASGGFGSGFLVVHRDASGAAAFVVTNRHVIAGSADAEVSFGDGTTYKNCEIVFANPKSDVAVLALPESAIRTFDHGLRPARAAIKERLTVVATGFPAVAGKPSFQMTEGKISNAAFSQPELGMSETVYQHTAPIDPGSSGGPLTNEAGELVGANVALIRGRSSMFFAVPASSVADTVRRAHELVTRRHSADWMARELTSSCNALAAELTSKHPDFQRVDSFVSNQLVADEGFVSFDFAATRPSIGTTFREAFFREPIHAMRASVLFRVLLRAQVDDGATGECGAVNPTDLTAIAGDKPVRLALKTRRGEMELRWGFDQGSWRIVGGDLLDVERIMAVEERDEAEATTEAKEAKKAPAKKAAKHATKTSATKGGR